MIRSDKHHKGSKNSICCIKPYQTFESNYDLTKNMPFKTDLKKGCRQYIFGSQIILIECIINHFRCSDSRLLEDANW